MQNVSQESSTDNPKIDKVTVLHELGNSSSTPQSTTSNSSPAKSETETYSEHRRYMSETSESEEDSVSEVESFMIDQEFEDDPQVEAAKFLLNPDEDRAVDPETQARLEQLLQAAGIGQLAAKDGKHLGDPEVLRRLTSSVSCALDEAAAALTRMRSDNPPNRSSNSSGNSASSASTNGAAGQAQQQQPQQQLQQQQAPEKTSLVEACTDGDVGTVRKLLTEGRSVHETSEEGESLLSLACSAGYFELAQVLLAMHANVEDRGMKGECTPLMEAASAGHLDIVRLLVAHGADVNAQSASGNTPLMYGCAGGHTEVVKFLLENGANVEDHNENGHTPLMEAASAGHVGLAKILLSHGAGINTHSNEFKESALTLACYKGHLDMVRFLLEAGADQEHKTDEMHTALMEASMDGHVEVARLLLDSGAQVNMPTDSFESPLTLAACGGHVDLAMLLIERGANIEEVNDEGYTPLMEAAREGHEEMVHLLLGQGSSLPGANINAQTDETQETALTLACCGGFTEVADILLKGGADIELGASTPLMEAAQEGHLDLVRFLLENGANVHAQTQTGDTALTYACENGHTDVADLLLQYGADLEHESEGGRTPLMKACRAGHLCTVQFLISKGANVRRQTTNNDHTPLSLACAGGHLPVVELLLSHNADPNHKLKDNSTMLIEAAKGGHTNVVQLLLDYPHSMQPMMLNQHQQGATAATNLSMLPGQVGSRDSPLPPGTIAPNLPPQPINFYQSPTAVLQEVPDAVRIVQQEDGANPSIDVNKQQVQQQPGRNTDQTKASVGRKILPKSRSTGAVFDGNLTSAEAQQVRTQPLEFEDEVFMANAAAVDFLNTDEPNSTLIEFIKNRKKQQFNGSGEDGSSQKQQILEELHRVERDLHGKTQGNNHVFQYGITQEQCPSSTTNALPHMLNIDIAMQQQKQQGLGTGMLSGTLFPGQNLQVHNAFYAGGGGAGSPCLQAGAAAKLQSAADQSPAAAAAAAAAAAFVQQNQKQQQQQQQSSQQQSYYFSPIPTNSSSSVAVSLATASSTANGTLQPGAVVTPVSSNANQPPAAPAAQIKFQSVTSHAEVSQNTAISDRPKAKPVSKKEGKNLRKQQQLQQQQQSALQQQTLPQQQTVIQQQQPQPQIQTFQPNLYAQQPCQILGQIQLQPPQQLQVQAQQFQQQDTKTITQQEILNVPGLDLASINEDTVILKNDNHENLLTASILQQFHNTSIPALRATFVGSPQKTRLELYDHTEEGNKVTKLELSDPNLPSVEEVVQQLESFNTTEVSEQSLSQHNLQVQPYPSALDESMIASLAAQQDLPAQTDLSRVEYFAVPTNGPQVPVHTLYPYEHYLGAGLPKDQLFQAGFQAGYSLMQQQLACPNANGTETLATTNIVPTSVGPVPGTSTQQYITPQQQPVCTPSQTPCSLVGGAAVTLQQTHHCQMPCSQHQTHQQTNQVQAATQTAQAAQAVSGDAKKVVKSSGGDGIKFKKGRVMRHQNQVQNSGTFPPSQNYQIDHNSAITQYSSSQQQCPNAVIPPCMDVDSETESNHDTALTLACAGGHEELVELLISRGADIEHRDKKGFTPLILAATAGHEKVVEILLNHNADIEAQSERTKDTPLSLACSGGRYEVVELLLNRNANKEHRNVSDYTPLSLAASGGYVNIIKLLLSHGAEINSRTGSKLGISPLMLAAMNGHTAAVKLLLDMGSDINAQIETNRNTALTLACFQGRHEVVSLLLDRKANVEHRAKTGLTPLMEAASGGYVDVGRVLLDKGADVNATPVPSSRDTALTIAADKGHVRFVELLLCRGAQVEVKNKKGNSPLWLAANGGHLPVVELLYNVKADIDSQDNRKVSCLMAAFRKGHVKVVKWMVHHVTQFPSDQEMMRYNATVSDKELLEKCSECVKIIRAAKETQAAKANKNASILLEELESEKTREESKRLAAARRRERKKKKKLEKKEERRKLLEENKKNENYDEKQDEKENLEEEKAEEEENVPEVNPAIRNGDPNDKEEGDSGIDANSQGSCSSADLKSKEKRKEKKKKKTNTMKNNESHNRSKASSSKASELESPEKNEKSPESKMKQNSSVRKAISFNHIKSPADRDDFEATGNEVYVSTKKIKSIYEEPPTQSTKNSTSPKQSSKREEGWKEVVRKSSVQTLTASESGVKKVSVPLNAISRVIGRGGSNINAIRGATGAHIEVEKQSKGQGERIITIKGSAEATKQAHNLIATLIKDPDVDILSMLPKTNKIASTATTLWDKTQIGTKKNAGKIVVVSSSSTVIHANPKVTQTVATSTVSTSRFSSTTSAKPRSSVAYTSLVRTTAPRLVAQAEKNAAAQTQNQMRTSISHPSSTASRPPLASKVITSSVNQTFAAKLTETSVGQLMINTNHTLTTSKLSRMLDAPHSAVGPISPQLPPSSSGNTQSSPNRNARPTPTASAPPNMQHFQSPGKATPMFGVNSQNNTAPSIEPVANTMRSSTPNGALHLNSAAVPPPLVQEETPNMQAPSEYSLFYAGDHWNRREQEFQKPVNFAAVTGGGNAQTVAQHKFIDQEPPPQADASKAPGYRGAAVCSPVSSKTSSNSTTPPNISANNFQAYQEQNKAVPNTLPPIGSNVAHNRPPPPVSQNNPDIFGELFKHGGNNIPNMLTLANEAHLLQNLNFSQPQQHQQQTATMSRLNPKAPEYSSYNMQQNKPSPHMYNGYQNNMYMAKQQQQQQQQPTVDSYHRTPGVGLSSAQNRHLWMQMQPPFTPQQSEQLISGIAGMTLHNIAKFTAGNEVMENGAELGIVNNSPNMSPNMPPVAHNYHPDAMYGVEDRKPPQPIGTGRKYANPMENWRSNDKGDKWALGNNSDYSMRNPQMYADDLPPIDYTRQMPTLDNTHNFMNGPQYFNQPQMNAVRHDFMQDIPKLDLSWDNNPRPIPELQDKQHGWTNKWNQ